MLSPRASRPPTKAAEYLLIDIHYAAHRQRIGHYDPPAQDRTFPTGNAATAQTRAAAAIELDALGQLALRYISDCPELGLTQHLLDIALNAEAVGDVYLSLQNAAGR